ncbi:MAG: hypothetical protein AEth_00302 [Candidatus Argoarchaeum ethanivorans]|uniref:Uncharacterized protein n=1 Tax=Candidatus Argoarchaeum ethanivorans TaxID=2608793 RepID=A0A8B3S4F9_9EURY|nr:MAG: hypothetical protein AEth_00302 [Candidatus Argoarchaeum ethanivorans]
MVDFAIICEVILSMKNTQIVKNIRLVMDTTPVSIPRKVILRGIRRGEAEMICYIEFHY